MKIRFIFPKKADDAEVRLNNVPFDTARFDEVRNALQTLGADVESVSKIVQLASRSNKEMKFNFTGPEEVLKRFFEKYYAHMTWEQIRAEYPVDGRKNKDLVDKKDGAEEGKRLVEDMTRFLIKHNIKNVSATLDEAKLELVFTPYTSEIKQLFVAELVQGDYKQSEITKIFLKHGFDFINQKNDRILLKRV